MARCKFCGKEIDWITSLEGKQVPVDPDPVFVIEDGSPEAFLDDTGATITGRTGWRRAGTRSAGNWESTATAWP